MTQKIETDVQKANRLVRLTDVLSQFGVYVPDSSGRSVKARCPYADMYHLDNEAGKSMRVYADTNTGNCFMGCGTLTPVSVYASLKELSYRVAAKELLDQAGYKPKSFKELWEESLNPTEEVDKTSYRDALMEYCYCITPLKWGSLQYESSVSETMTKLLDILDRAESETQAEIWFAKAKERMQAIIREENPYE